MVIQTSKNILLKYTTLVIFMLYKTYWEEAKYLILKGDEGLNLYIYTED